MEERILLADLNKQADGFSPRNRLVRTNTSCTTSSKDTLHIRKEISTLYETATSDNSTPTIEPTTGNDSSSVSTYSVEETPGNNTYIQPRRISNGILIKYDRGFYLHRKCLKSRRSQSSSHETIYEDPYAGNNEYTEYAGYNVCEAPKDTETEPIINEHSKSVANNRSKINWHIVKEIICIILGIIGVFSLAAIGFHLFKSLSVSCENEECLDVDCTDSCTLCKNYKRIYHMDLNDHSDVSESICLRTNDRNCTIPINGTAKCEPVMSLFVIGGLAMKTTSSKSNKFFLGPETLSAHNTYNFAFPRLLETHFEFENGPVKRDDNVIQHYRYGRLPQSAISVSFCSVQVKDEIFILGGNATFGAQGVNVFKIETTRNVHLVGGRFAPVYHNIEELNWKLSMPFIKHVCSAVRNHEIWLCSTDAQIKHGCITCIATTLDGEQLQKQYLSHAHVSGNLLTIQDKDYDTMVIIGGRNARNPGEADIVAKNEVEFCDQGMSFTTSCHKNG